MDPQTDDQTEPLRRIAKSLESLEKLYGEHLRQSELRMANIDKLRAETDESMAEANSMLNRMSIFNLRKNAAIAFLALIFAIASLVVAFTR